MNREVHVRFCESGGGCDSPRPLDRSSVVMPGTGSGWAARLAVDVGRFRGSARGEVRACGGWWRAG